MMVMMVCGDLKSKTLMATFCFSVVFGDTLTLVAALIAMTVLACRTLAVIVAQR